MLKPLIISAPVGNYVHFPQATSTLGTFTLFKRRGRLIRVVKTLRYYSRLKAWVNKIGLRNPGIDYLLTKEKKGYKLDDKIVSIHGFNDDEWYQLLKKLEQIPENNRPYIELNISCPNVGQIHFPKDLFFKFQKARFPGVIVKIPPVNYRATIKIASESGIKYIHCTNTLPVACGGLSGKPLKLISLEVIRDIKKTYQDFVIIGGGGITSPKDVEEYKTAGAEHISVCTYLFRLRTFFSLNYLKELIPR